MQRPITRPTQTVLMSIAVLGLSACANGVLIAVPASRSTNPAAVAALPSESTGTKPAPPIPQGANSSAAANRTGSINTMKGMDHGNGGDMTSMNHGDGTKGSAVPEHAGHGTGAVAAGGSKDAAGAPATAASRTVQVAALDSMRFQPDVIKVRSGETIRFVITNQGKIRHEFVLASPQEQREHDAMMAAMVGGKAAMKHHADNAVTIDPGETKTIIWRFPESGMVEFACHEPGHYPAGMKGSALVER